MKPIPSLFLILALLTAGCADKQSAAKIAALEQRIAKQEADIKALETGAAQTTKILGLTTELAKLIQEDNKAIWERFKLQDFSQSANAVMISQHENSIRALDAGMANAGLKTPMKDGVPTAVYIRIKADAEKTHPNDFKSQTSYIDRQTEAYRKLHP